MAWILDSPTDGEYAGQTALEITNADGGKVVWMMPCFVYRATSLQSINLNLRKVFIQWYQYYYNRGKL